MIRPALTTVITNITKILAAVAVFRHPGGLHIDRRLRTDFSWVLSGNVIYSACQWGIVLSLAKLGSTEQVGLYALGMAVSAPIVVFANLQVRTLLASDVREEFRFGQYLAFRLISLAAALLVIVAAAACVASDSRRRLVIVLVGVAQALDYVSDTYYGLMQKFGRMDRLSRSLLLKGPFALAALCAVMYVTRDVAWAVAALALGRLFILLIWDSRVACLGTAAGKLSAKLEWDAVGLACLLRLSIPLGVISMLGALSVNIPRYFIEARLGTSDLGIYSAIASLLTAGTLVVSAFGQTIMVPAAKACADGDRDRFKRFAFQTALLATIPGAGALLLAVLAGPEVLERLFRPEYSSHADIFVWLMAAGTVIFVTSGLGFVMTAARALVPQVPLLLANCAAAALFSAWWIPRHGVRGAAEATLVAALVQLAGSGVILWRVDRRLRTLASSGPAPVPAGFEAPA